MRQTLHLLIVDRRTDAALATWHGSRWLLPIVTSHERLRADAALLRWASQRGVNGELVGQWLGRVTPDATDWLGVISATATPAASEPAWAPLDSLANATPLIDYQGWALTTVLQRHSSPSVPGPFGSFAWLDDVKSWVGASLGATSVAITPYRVTSHEVVLGVDAAHGRTYFKGLTPERAGEARLTQALAALAPFSFAATLAFDERADGSVWWLTAGCLGEHGHGYEQVARALARVQCRVMASGSVIRALPRIALDAAVRWASGLLNDPRCATAMEQALARVATASAPESWVPMDLDPTNVLVHGGEVRFIDLDDSYFGPAPLAMAVFVRRCRDRTLHETYEQSWSPPLVGIDWPAFALVAAVFEGWLAWQRVTRNTERGEVSGALDLAACRIRERLVRAVHR